MGYDMARSVMSPPSSAWPNESTTLPSKPGPTATTGPRSELAVPFAEDEQEIADARAKSADLDDEPDDVEDDAGRSMDLCRLYLLLVRLERQMHFHPPFRGKSLPSDWPKRCASTDAKRSSTDSSTRPSSVSTTQPPGPSLSS